MFFCIAYILHSASLFTSWLSSQHAKDFKVTSPIPRKTGNAKRFENRGHLDAEQPGAAAHGTVSIACSFLSLRDRFGRGVE